MPIDPSFASPAAVAPDRQIAPASGAGRAQAPGSGFGDLLASRSPSLTARQTRPRRLAGVRGRPATDPTQVVMAVERARLSMQLASQVRTKAVEASQDIFHTQV